MPYNKGREFVRNQVSNTVLSQILKNEKNAIGKSNLLNQALDSGPINGLFTGDPNESPAQSPAQSPALSPASGQSTLNRFKIAQKNGIRSGSIQSINRNGVSYNKAIRELKKFKQQHLIVKKQIIYGMFYHNLKIFQIIELVTQLIIFL